MANQSLSLGQHWNKFIDNKISEGRYMSASEVVRDALRLLEKSDDERLNNLRAMLIEGENSGNAGEVSLEKIKQNIKNKLK